MFAQPSRLARGMRDPSLPHAPAYHHTHYGHQRQPRCLPRVSSIEGPAGSGMPVDPQELWQRLSLAKRYAGAGCKPRPRDSPPPPRNPSQQLRYLS